MRLKRVLSVDHSMVGNSWFRDWAGSALAMTIFICLFVAWPPVPVRFFLLDFLGAALVAMLISAGSRHVLSIFTQPQKRQSNFDLAPLTILTAGGIIIAALGTLGLVGKDVVASLVYVLVGYGMGQSRWPRNDASS